MSKSTISTFKLFEIFPDNETARLANRGRGGQAMTVIELINILKKLPLDEKLYLEDSEYGDLYEVLQVYRSHDGERVVIDRGDYLEESWQRCRPDLTARVIK